MHFYYPTIHISIKVEPTQWYFLNISKRSMYSWEIVVLMQMIRLVTKFIYVCMTFEMLHKHDKNIKQKNYNQNRCN
jgi:hypothetical protein